MQLSTYLSKRKIKLGKEGAEKKCNKFYVQNSVHNCSDQQRSLRKGEGASGAAVESKGPKIGWQNEYSKPNTTRRRTYNVTLRRVRATIVAVEKQYYVF